MRYRSGARQRREVGELWEAFAREHPEYYICTELADYGIPPDLASFFSSAEPEVREILTSVETWLPARRVAIEVGAGVGRLAIPMANVFEKVYAVDISATMLARLRENLAQRRIENVAPVLAADAATVDAQADLVYSRLVFQHIESPGDIRQYIELVRRWLGESGVAYLQFDTRAETLVYRVRNRVPDSLLPRTSRRGIRRIRRRPGVLAEWLAENGLSVRAELRPRSEDHIFVVTATASSPH
jgi:SAM-dependent methyltransferase